MTENSVPMIGSVAESTARAWLADIEKRIVGEGREVNIFRLVEIAPADGDTPAVTEWKPVTSKKTGLPLNVAGTFGWLSSAPFQPASIVESAGLYATLLDLKGSAKVDDNCYIALVDRTQKTRIFRSVMTVGAFIERFDAVKRVRQELDLTKDRFIDASEVIGQKKEKAAAVGLDLTDAEW